ncbi:ABC transporter substrate-binding protein [Demequina sediminicola]|uniref:ABC transporter substrate-binding protein n=1 Tax=Demequina sediminicola TaxID=1095026 RepID=UPI000781E8C4|nr:extracellular solute-binding protein [Demequina sediminicola]
MMKAKKSLGAVAAVSGLALTLAACSSGDDADTDTSAGAGGEATAGAATVWVTAGTESVLDASIAAWNETGNGTLEMQTFENDPFKQKLRTAVSAGEGPTVFSGWGGGGLAEYVKEGAVESLQSALDAEPELRDRIFPAVLAGGTVNDEIYALPINGVQPVVFYMNQAVLDEAGVAAPTTWDELMAAVPVLKEAGVAPISIGGASKWPYLMWIAYLTDRIGGPEVFDAVVAGEPGAWEDPAIIEAASMIQDLVEAGGFVDGYSAVDANQGAAEALVYTGKAAMQLQGAWAYSGTYSTAAADFVEAGDLTWTTFPEVEGGAGDPTNVTGNLSSYFSITADSAEDEKATAMDWLLHGVMDDQYVDDLTDTGAVPPISGLEDKIAETDAPEWNEFVYSISEDAGNFQLSWDQALDATQADALLTNLEQVFLLQITPEEFAANLNEVAQQG